MSSFLGPSQKAFGRTLASALATSAGLVASSPEAQALSPEPKIEIVIVRPTRPTPGPSGTPETLEACTARVSALFETEGLDPRDTKAREAIQGYCSSASQELVLVSRKERPEPTLTIDVTGSYRRGNIDSGSIAGSIGYGREWQRHGLELSFSGEYLQETDGFTYHRLSATVQDELFLTGHWSLFGFASVGRDTRRELAFSASEFVGVMFNLFGRESKLNHEIKLSTAVGHRYEEQLNGLLFQTDTEDLSVGFANNNFVASHRIKYTGKFLNETLEIVAAAWLQHILYSPEQNGRPPRWLDLSDYRVIAQLGIKLKIADLGETSELFFEIGGTYEYFSKTLANSKDDLSIQGGIGVKF
jgi:hypothetical protein